MQFSSFKYLAPKAKQLIPQWAKNWEHPEKIPEIHAALAEFRQEFVESEAAFQKRISSFREVGRRLKLAFERKDEYERDVLLYEARRWNAIACSFLGVDAASRPDVVVTAKGNPLDELLYIVQARIASRMAVCLRADCKKTYYFRKPGRHGQKYCSTFCFETANQGNDRQYQEIRAKEVAKRHFEQSGMTADKIEKLLNGESVRFDD